MQRQRQQNAFVLFAVITLVLTPTAGMAASVPDEVTRIAQQGLKRFVSSVAGPDMEDCGIPAGTFLEHMSLGKSFELHEISPQALTSNRTVTSVQQLITGSTQYYFPVLINGTTKAILIVDKMNGQWRAVSLGYPGLAAELALIKAAWPEEQGFHPALIVMRQANSMLFTIPEKGETNLTPVRMCVGPKPRRPESAGQPVTSSTAQQDYKSIRDITEALHDLRPSSAVGKIMPNPEGK